MEQDGIQVFSVNEIKLFGKQDAKYKRATQCIGNLSNIKIGHHLTGDDGGDDIFEASCCYIETATCSCPYQEKFSKADDHCKHILAFLLKSFCYDYQPQKFDCAISCLQKSSKVAMQGLKDSISRPRNPEEATKKRELPAWMKIKQENTSKSGSTKKKRLSLLSKDVCAPKKNERIWQVFDCTRKKQGSSVKRTVYCMTPGEFSLTAQEILREAELQLETEKLKDAKVIEKTQNLISGEEESLTKMDVTMKRESQSQILAKDDQEYPTLETILLPVDTTQREKDLLSSAKTSTFMEAAGEQTITGLSIDNSEDTGKDDFSILDELM